MLSGRDRRRQFRDETKARKGCGCGGEKGYSLEVTLSNMKYKVSTGDLLASISYDYFLLNTPNLV